MNEQQIIMRAYFATHAPAVPEWFKLEPPQHKPHMPQTPSGFTPEQLLALETFVSHETCPDRFVSQHVRRREQAKAEQDAWRDACREKKFFAWRWYYADQMLAMSPT